MSDPELYLQREQTFVKHFILQKYLERFARIVGTRWDAITYVDCFSGPWNVRSKELKDSSFAVALDELQKAKRTLKDQNRSLQLRCFFLEKDPVAYAKLEQFAKQVQDAEVETRNSELEDAIGDIVEFVRKGGRRSFPFVFIDPTGWTGLAMKVIAPLLRLEPGEMLINFMTGHIGRFVESSHEPTQESFESFYGSSDYKAKLQGLAGQDREDAAVRCYMDSVKATGRLPYVCPAIVLHPEIDRTHFHLIYATRNLKGVEVFKDVEKKAMPVMERARANAQQRKRMRQTQNLELFDSPVLSGSTLYDNLRQRYLTTAKRDVRTAIEVRVRVPYDDLWLLALSQPMVWESDLKSWIDEWQKRNELQIEGLKPNQRVPQRGKRNFVVHTRRRNAE